VEIEAHRYLWTSVLCFSELVQPLVITYNEIFQGLALEGDVLFLKPFLDPTPPCIQPQLGPLGQSRVWQTEKTSPRLAVSI
jgi:hypothetical protein